MLSSSMLLGVVILQLLAGAVAGRSAPGIGTELAHRVSRVGHLIHRSDRSRADGARSLLAEIAFLRSVTYDQAVESSARSTTMRDLRAGNRAEVLRRLHRHGPASRHELATLTRLSPATVSTVTAELLDDGLLEVAGRVTSAGGRPRVLLRIPPDAGYGVGVEVGETGISVRLYDLGMTRRAEIEHPLLPDRHEPARVVDHIADGVAALPGIARIPPERVLGVGVGVPGIVQQRTSGSVVHGRAFGWEGVPLQPMLAGRLAYPVIVQNGAKVSAQGELWYGAGSGTRHLVVALIGSGVGAGVVLNGRICTGVGGGAGEWGHTVVQLGGRSCRCGSSGCLQTYIGAEGILGRHRERCAVVHRDVERGERVDSHGQRAELAGLLTAHDCAAACDVSTETVAYLGAGLANLLNLINPERVVLSGWAGLLLAQSRLSEIRAATARYALARPYRQAEIVSGQLGEDTVAAGAATLVVERFLGSGGRSVSAS